MDKNLLEIHEYTGEGYRPLIDYGTWRVAVLRYLDELQPDRITFLERHNETDEVFVLLQGQAVLFMGSGEDQIESIFPQVMLPGLFYNVKRGAYHASVLSRDATILLVENRNTGPENSDRLLLNPEQCAFLFETVLREMPEWEYLQQTS
jgi:hypothetical protein